MRKIESEKYIDVWQFICKYRMTHGISPSLRDIMEEVEIASTSTVIWYGEGLSEHGWLEKTPETCRGLVPTNEVIMPPPKFVHDFLNEQDREEVYQSAVWQLLDYMSAHQLKELIEVVSTSKELLNEREPTY